MNYYRNVIEKKAGLGNIIKRTAIGSGIGAGLGAMKATSKNEQNPSLSADDKIGNMAINTIGGALGGAAASNLLGAGANKVKGMFKHSEMEVPNDDEKGLNKDEAKDEVLDSPNDIEKKRMVNSISEEDEKKQYYKNLIEKSAVYCKDIKCQQCGYEGLPDSKDGRCPKCGAMNGIKPKEVVNDKMDADILEARDTRISRLYDQIANSREERFNRIF